MSSLRRRLGRLDWLSLIIMVLLLLVGVITLLSTQLKPDGSFDFHGIVASQLLFIGAGLVVYIVIALFFDFSYLRYLPVAGGLFAVGVILLLYTVFMGVGGAESGADRWIRIGSMTIQPSEFVKVILIIWTSAVLSYKDRIGEVRAVALTLIGLGILVALLLAQPHLGMTVLYVALWGVMVFTVFEEQKRNAMGVAIFVLAIIGGAGFALHAGSIGVTGLALSGILSVFAMAGDERYKKFFVVVTAISMVSAVLVYGGARHIHLADYQKARVEAFLNPNEGDEAAQFNRRQAIIAIGSGRLTGKGFGLGTQSRLKILRERTNDFIFAVFAEQFGFLGSFALMILYFALVGRIFYLYRHMRSGLFASLLVAGIAWKLFLEISLNLATNMGMIPQTGIPLPMMSSGGSIMLSTLISLALVQSVVVASKDVDKSINGFVDTKDILL